MKSLKLIFMSGLLGGMTAVPLMIIPMCALMLLVEGSGLKAPAEFYAGAFTMGIMAGAAYGISIRKKLVEKLGEP